MRERQEYIEPEAASGSELSAQSPVRDSNPWTVRSSPVLKSDTWPTEPPRSPKVCQFCVFKTTLSFTYLFNCFSGLYFIYFCFDLCYFLLLLTLGLVYSFCISLKFKVRLFIWDHIFLIVGIYHYQLPSELFLLHPINFGVLYFGFHLFQYICAFPFDFSFDPLVVQNYVVQFYMFIIFFRFSPITDINVLSLFAKILDII